MQKWMIPANQLIPKYMIMQNFLMTMAMLIGNNV